MYRMLVRVILGLAVLLFGGNADAQTRLFGGQPTVALADVTCDITTGVAIGIGSGTCIASPAVCNGVADDSAAFTAFNSWAVNTWQAGNTGLIGLKIPSGKNCQILSSTVLCGTINANLKCPFNNIKRLVVLGGGQNSTTLTVAASALVSLSGMGIAQDNKHSARATTVSAGSSCVTLTSTPTATVSNAANNGSGKWRITLNSTAGFVSGQSYFFASIGGASKINGLQIVTVIDATNVDLPALSADQVYTSGGTVGGDRTSLFTVGKYAMMAGFDIQGLWLSPFGFPPNFHYFEHVKVASKDSGTGQVCFDAPLRNAYKSTWPLYNSGSIFEVDAGGPATLYFLDPSWDNELEVRDITIDRTAAQTYAIGRSVTYRNVKFTGINCGVPTQNVTWSAINSDFSTCNVEVDKLIGTVLVSGSTFNFLKFQSSSTDLLTMSGSTILSSIDGTPKIANISNSTLAKLAPGAFAYGRSDETTCANCAIATFVDQGFTQPTATYSMAGGIITFPNTAASGSSPDQRWAVPGSNIFLRGSSGVSGIFQVLDVTQDATTTYIQTNLAGGFPAYPGLDTFKTHPAPRFTCSNCTGAADVVSFSSAPARSPLYSYQTRTYTGAIGTTVQPRFVSWGSLATLSFNITNAYSGAGTLSFVLSQFNNWPVILSTDAAGSYNNAGGGPVINAKIVANRVVAPSGVTGTQAGDAGLATLDAAKMWFTGQSNSGPLFSANVSASCPGANCPSLTVTIQTDQGVVNP